MAKDCRAISPNAIGEAIRQRYIKAYPECISGMRSTTRHLYPERKKLQARFITREDTESLTTASMLACLLRNRESVMRERR
jgi:hypothetical protein